MIKENILTRAFTKEKVFPYALKFTVLLGILVAAPFLHFQAVTGTMVNAMLIVAVMMLGRKEAITIGIFPSLISVVTGLLAPAVTPLIPFIIFSNIILILTFDALRRKNYWKGIIWGSILKFTFLFLAARVLAFVFAGSAFVKIAAMMFSWQQLLTALSGGIVAYVTLKTLKRI